MYTQNSDWLQNIKSVLPSHAQTIYRKVFNNALEEYKDPYSIVHTKRARGERHE